MPESLPRPDDQLIIDGLEPLKVTADPLRMRLIEILRRAPATVKELAAILEVSPKSLYYHVNLLQRHGLIRVVDTRLVSGILEKRYQAAAYLFVFRDLNNQSDGAQGTQEPVSSLLAITGQELAESIARGRINYQDKDIPSKRTLHWDWQLLQLSVEEAAAFSTRLQDLLDDYSKVDGVPMAQDRQTYRFFDVFFPTYSRGAPSVHKQPE